MNENSPHQVKRHPARDRLSLGLLIGFSVLAIAAAVGCFFLARNLVDTWNMTPLPGAPDTSAVNQPPSSPGTTALPNATPAATNEPLMPGPTAVPWDGNSRVTILVMGLDYRDWSENANAPSRTDSMILLTIDPLSKTAGMLSIPRDMWVNIPGFDYGPINTAYFLGDAFKVPGGGPGLAVATVEEFLGVPIQYYAQIDFAAFTRFIDELGGVDIIVHETMHISLVGKPDMFELKPGLQTLDGPTLLAYARARHDDEGNLTEDYARAARQQEVIMAIRDQILQFNMLPTLIAKAPTLYQDLSAGLRTNLQLDQILKLAMLAQSIDEKKIKRGLINVTDVVQTKAILSDGTNKDVLVPRPEKISPIRDFVFTVNPAIRPGASSGDTSTLIRNEKSRILLQNGADQPDLAIRTSEYFKAQGLNVVEQASAAQPQSTSSITIYTGKPYTIKYICKLLNIPESAITNEFNPDSQIDMMVILGNDWASQNPMP